MPRLHTGDGQRGTIAGTKVVYFLKDGHCDPERKDRYPSPAFGLGLILQPTTAQLLTPPACPKNPGPYIGQSDRWGFRSQTGPGFPPQWRNSDLRAKCGPTGDLPKPIAPNGLRHPQNGPAWESSWALGKNPGTPYPWSAGEENQSETCEKLGEESVKAARMKKISLPSG